MKLIDVTYQDLEHRTGGSLKLDIHAIMVPLLQAIDVKLSDQWRNPVDATHLVDRIYEDHELETQVHPRCGFPREFCNAPREHVTNVMTNAQGRIIGFLCDKHRRLYAPSLQLDEPMSRAPLLPPTVPGMPR
jgi:hypothetical protein